MIWMSAGAGHCFIVSHIITDDIWKRSGHSKSQTRRTPCHRTHPSPDGSGIAGVLLIDIRTGVYRFVQAKTVLLGTGAGPTMYKYHTPSGDKTCDGLAMALRYGLPLRDMEMVQFHPTGILAGDSTRMTGTILGRRFTRCGRLLARRQWRAFYEQLSQRCRTCDARYRLAQYV